MDGSSSYVVFAFIQRNWVKQSIWAGNYCRSTGRPFYSLRFALRPEHSPLLLLLLNFTSRGGVKTSSLTLMHKFQFDSLICSQTRFTCMMININRRKYNSKNAHFHIHHSGKDHKQCFGPDFFKYNLQDCFMHLDQGTA